MSKQTTLFEEEAEYPEGFKYRADFLSPEQEKNLISSIEKLPFKVFIFQGYEANRRTVSFGWRYDFSDAQLKEAEEIPEFLVKLKSRGAKFAGITPGQLQHVLVTEYIPGAGIGWHKDKGVFDLIVGISILSSSVLRLRKKKNNKWERFNITAEPRSIYVFSGEVRSEWEHSIPPVDNLRYSITFRTLKEG